MNVYEGKEKYIFVSYSNKDGKQVLPIIKFMQEQGFRIWYDRDIDVNNEKPEYIQTHLSKSTCLLVFMSNNAIASQDCRDQINFALHNNLDVLVVYLEETELTHGMGLQLEATQSLFKYRHQDEESFLSELCTAKILWSCSSQNTGGSLFSQRILEKRKRNLFKKGKSRVNKKRVLLVGSIIAVVVVIIAVVLAFNSHVHNPGDWIIEREPGFGIEGAAYKVCSICGNRCRWGRMSELDIKYSFNEFDNTCVITSISQTTNQWVTNLIIPSQYKGYTITGLEKDAFANLPNLISVTYPESITTITAIGGSKTIQTIVLPNVVQRIDDSAFANCTNLETINLPDGVISIGSSAFRNCSKLRSISLPSSIISIGSRAFEKCTLLSGITIPNGVTTIGDSAFKGCANLTSVTISDSVTSIGNSVFEDCVRLCYNLYDNAYYLGNESNPYLLLVKATDESIESCAIYDNTRFIHSGAFRGCKNLVQIAISNCISSIGQETFYNCTNLTSIDIPDSVITIDNSAFFGCANLASIDIPDSVTTIGNSAFSGCSSLTNVVIPKSVTIISGYTFSDCICLTNVDIPDSVTTIGNSAFSGCTNLICIDIPKGVNSIEDYAFFNCANLIKITIPNNVSSIGVAAFGMPALSDCYERIYNQFDNACYLGNDSNPYLLLVKASSKYISTCIVHENTRFIHSGAFEFCDNLMSINIPNSVTNIGVHAFSNCTSLTTVVIEGKITVIARETFLGCDNLTTVTIPRSVSIIAGDSFYGCTNLKNILYEGTVAEWKAIKQIDWDSKTGDYTIHCSDGDISKQ